MIVHSIAVDNMRLRLKNGNFTQVDREDFKKLSKIPWNQNGNYASVHMNGKRIPMQRFILGVFDPNLIVDHINRNGLDNRKKNLRVCTRAESAYNRVYPKKKNSYSQYRGVTKYNNRWMAQIQKNYKVIFLGRFKTEQDAARAYNEAAKKHFGEFAVLNKIK